MLSVNNLIKYPHTEFPTKFREMLTSMFLASLILHDSAVSTIFFKLSLGTVTAPLSLSRWCLLHKRDECLLRRTTLQCFLSTAMFSLDHTGKWRTMSPASCESHNGGRFAGIVKHKSLLPPFFCNVMQSVFNFQQHPSSGTQAVCQNQHLKQDRFSVRITANVRMCKAPSKGIFKKKKKWFPVIVWKLPVFPVE